jgi:hypothetical protein
MMARMVGRRRSLFLNGLVFVGLVGCGPRHTHPSLTMRQPSHNLLLVDDEEIHIAFEDATKVVGQPCPCAAAGFRIASLGLSALSQDEIPVRGEVRLVASRDHAITDVVGYIIGLERRQEQARTDLVLDPALSDDPGVWRYLFLDPERARAAEVTYFKWRLMEEADRHDLVAIEERAERGQASPAERDRFRRQMVAWVQVLMDPVSSRRYFDVRPMDYEEATADYPGLAGHREH